MRKPTGERLQGRWSMSHGDRCRHCGRNDRPHGGLGFCETCYTYHSDPEREKAKRKAARVAKDIVAKRYPKVRAWHEANADKVREYKRKWYQQHAKPKYPLGMLVWIKEGPWWLEGTIVEKPNNSTIIVKVRGSGRLVRTAGRWVKSENPVACHLCAEMGLLVIVTPVSVDLIVAATKCLPKDTIIDSALGEHCGAFVLGSRKDCDAARKRLGLVKPALEVA